MLTPEQVRLVEGDIQDHYDKHVGDLLDALSRIKDYQPQSRVPLNKVYDVFLTDTRIAQDKYAQELLDNIVRLTQIILPQLREIEVQKIMDICEPFTDEALYAMRYKKFEESLRRHLKRFDLGLRLPSQRIRTHYESLSQTSAANFCRATRLKLRRELDLLVVAQTVQEPSQLTDVLEVKPGAFGINVDLKLLGTILWQKIKRRIT